MNLDRIVNAAVLRIGNLESDELYSKIVREACLAAVAEEREACAKIAEKIRDDLAAECAERAIGGEGVAVIEKYSGATGTAELVTQAIRARSQSPP